MGWFRRLFGPEKKNFLADAVQISPGGISPYAGGLSLSGSELSARQSVSVMAIVNWAMEQFPEPPLRVMKWSGDDWEPDQAHPLNALFAAPDAENPRASIANLLQVVAESLVLTGNAYVYKLRSASGQVVGLQAVPSNCIAPKVRAGVLEAYTMRDARGQSLDIPPDDVVHVRFGQDPTNQFLGRSRLREAAAAIATDREAQAYTYGLIRSPAPSMLLSLGDDTNPDPATVASFKAEVEERASGARAGSALFLPVKLTVTELNYSPDKLHLSEIHKTVEARIASVFNIHPVVVGFQAGLDKSTFANFSEARQAAVEQFLIPKWRSVEDAFTSQLLGEFGLTGQYRVDFDVDAVRALQEDTNALSTRVSGLFAANVIDRATAKRMLGLKPTPEDDGVYAYALKGGDLGDVMKSLARERAKDVPA